MAFSMLSNGVMPMPPPSSTTGRSGCSSPRVKTPAGAFASILDSTGYPHPEWFEVETSEAAAQEYEQMAREQGADS